MKKFIAKFVKRRCEIVVKETEMIEVLKVLDMRRFGLDGLAIANCGGMDQDRWYVSFDASEMQYDAVRKELLKREFKDVLIPVRDVFGREYFKSI